MPPALSPPTSDMVRRNALLAQEAPRGERVFMRRPERDVRARADSRSRACAHRHRAAGLRHHAAMAQNRTGAIAAAVEEQQHPRGIASGRERPLAALRHRNRRLRIDIVRPPARPIRPRRAVRGAPPSRPAAASTSAMCGWRRSRCGPRSDLLVEAGHHRTLLVLCKRIDGGESAGRSAGGKLVRQRSTSRGAGRYVWRSFASQVKAAKIPGSCRSCRSLPDAGRKRWSTATPTRRNAST